jgi:hypothetical protein
MKGDCAGNVGSLPIPRGLQSKSPLPPFFKGGDDVASILDLFSKGDAVLAIVEAAHTLVPCDNVAFPPLKKGGRGGFY